MPFGPPSHIQGAVGLRSLCSLPHPWISRQDHSAGRILLNHRRSPIISMIVLWSGHPGGSPMETFIKPFAVRPCWKFRTAFWKASERVRHGNSKRCLSWLSTVPFARETSKEVTRRRFVGNGRSLQRTVTKSGRRSISNLRRIGSSLKR